MGQFRGDGIPDSDMVPYLETEAQYVGFIQERVIVNFSEALRCEPRANLPQISTHRVRRGHNRGGQRRRGCDFGIPDHAADLFHQVGLCRDVFSGAPAWHGDGELPVRGLLNSEAQSSQDFCDLLPGDFLTEFSAYKIDWQSDL